MKRKAAPIADADNVSDLASTTLVVPSEKKRRTRKLVVMGVVVGVLVLAGIGLWAWHEQPSFCNAICHSPMDAYVESYYSNDEAFLVTAHAKLNNECLDCHVPTLDQQLSEGVKWITGDFSDPLPGMEYEDSFCLNQSCHDITRDGLAELTSDLPFNPHLNRHGDTACGTCHSMHGTSTIYCAQCHEDAEALSDSLGWTRD